MADRPSMKDGLSELFRRTDSGGASSESSAQDAVVKGRPYVTTIKVVGVGGAGTSAGGAPVVAQLARELGGVTTATATKPFGFEGNRRLRQALEGIDVLRDVADTVISIPNDRLLEVVERNTSVVEAFQHADDILRHGVQGITDLITVPGLINLDFADVRTIVKDAGTALLGIGMAGVLHDGAHVGEVEVDQTGDRDEVGDALDAVAEDVVGVLERLDDTGVAFHHLQEAVVGDADDRVGDVPEGIDALQGLAQAAIALEAERLGDDGDAHAADADDLDGRHVGPSFDDRVLGAALARHATPVGAPEELAQSILHARTICHSAPPARGRGTIRPLCLWDRTSAPRPR